MKIGNIQRNPPITLTTAIEYHALMQNIALIALISAFLVGCGGSEPEPKQVSIPYPTDQSAVEPTVARLLQNTGQALERSADDPMKWLRHGSALFANAYYGEAAQSFQHAISINPEMPQATYLLATAFWKANRQEEAIATLQTALTLIPEYDMGWRLLAKWQLERGETLEAERFARRAFELHSERIGTRYLLAQSMMDDGRYQEALPILEEVIESNTAPRWIYTLASQCYRQLDMQEKAELTLQQSGPPLADWPDPMFKHIPNLIAGKAELAVYALHLNEFGGSEKATPFLIKALKVYPEHVNVRVALSIALQKSGQLNQAEQLLKELQGEPNLNYWKQYASVYIAKNELANAEMSIQTALNIDLKNPNTYDIAALIAKKQGKKEEAVIRWEEAGRLYNELELWEKAELSLAYATENGSLSQSGLQSLALAQIELGHYIQAKATIQKLLAENPNHQIALELQSRLPEE